MPTYGDLEGAKPTGTLECYRKVCKRKLGQYNLQGIRDCGKMIKPAFQIAKNKVKLIGAQSTNVNLGSGGGSQSHLHSNSDLGKYNNSGSNPPTS